MTEFIESDLYWLIKNKELNSMDQIKEISQGIAKGLWDLHSFGILHLDLKPSNILVDSSLRVKICDFGLSQIQDPFYNNSNKVKSTPAYMAPEAIFNIDSEENKRFDSWSFGCVLYEIIFGKPLFLKAKGIQQLGSMIFLLFKE